jgi:hypothetical protein
VFGQVEVEEWIWRNRQCSYRRVLAGRIGVRSRGCSARLERAVCDFGAEHSFAQAAQRLQEHYGVCLDASRVREITLRHAGRAQQQLEKEYEQSFRILPARGAAQVVAEADGTMICTVAPGPRAQRRPREWKEMRLVAAQAQGQRSATYGATFGEVAEVGRRWGHCTRAAGWGLHSQIHVVADGAEWIRLQSQEVFGAQARVLLDFYHASEYLAAAAATCRPRAPEDWRRTQQRRLKQGASAKVLAALDPYQEPDHLPDEQAPVRAARRYLGHRLDQLDYPHALRLELPIGSGLIESGHRHVLQTRLKRPGAAWLPQNAEALAQLRVLRSNCRWAQLWN